MSNSVVPLSICAACTCFIIIPSIILVSLSFSSLHTVEYGLDFNAITMSVSNQTYTTAGLYFLGFGHSFIKYPRVIQTLEFTPGHRGRLHTRTADGLPLTLGVSFQYRYLPGKLFDLYLAFKGEQEAVYVNTATAVISNVACNYSAYTFFNDKQGIANDIQNRLTDVFEAQLYAHVEAFQISQVELPAVFQDAIVTSISTKQEITRSLRYKENMQVTFATNLMVSKQELTQTIATARGAANARQQSAQGNAKQTEQTVAAEMFAFGNLTESLNLEPGAALDYVFWDLMQDDYAEPKEFLIGVNPAAYINGGAGSVAAASAAK